VGRVAPDTHPLECQRLAIQERTGCNPLHVQAFIWLGRAFNAAISAQAEELRPLGLSPSGFNVLMALHNTPGHMMEPCQLAERLLVSRPSVTGLLDTLQAKGLIERRPHAEDRRRVIVGLTDEGGSVLQSTFAIHYSGQQELFADLEPEELATLVVLLRRIKGAVPPHLSG
jgi:DNA-binding MarR family transcriptional regulator